MNTPTRFPGRLSVATRFITIASLAVTPLLADNTWDGGGANGNWSDLANWGANTTPVSPTALTFGGILQLASNNDLFPADTLFNGITFGAGAGSFVVSGAGITLGGNIANNSSNLQTVNLNLALSAGRTVTTSAGGGDVTLGGTVAGSGFGLIKAGLGTLTLNGAAASTYTGATAVNGGTLLVDFANLATPTDLINPASPLTTGGGVLSIKGKSTGTTSQTLGNVTQTANTHNGIVVNANGGAGTTLALGTLGHNTGGTTLIDISSSGAGVTSASAVSNGLLSAGYLVKDATGTGFATKSGSNVVRYDDTTGTTLAGTATTGTVNYTTLNSVYSGGTLVLASGAQSLNSLVIDTTNNGGTIDLNTGIKTITGSGVLFRGANDATIANGQLGATNSELILHQLGSGKLTINGSAGAGTTKVTKDGSGEVILGGVNTFTGGLIVNDGTVTVNNTLGNSAVVVGGTTGATGANAVLNLNFANAMSANTLTINNANAVVNVGAANALGSAVTLTLTAGTLNINAAQTRSAALNINSGFTLGIGDNNAIGTANLVLGGGTVRANGAARTIANTFEQGNANTTIGGTQNLTFNGLFTNKGSATLTIANSGLTTFGGGITLRDTGTATRSLTLNGAGDVLINSAITNGSSLNGVMDFKGTGVTTLSGNNTYSGATTIGGVVGGSNVATTVKLGHANALGFGGTSSVNGSTTVNTGATLDLNGQSGINELIAINGTGVGGAGALINSNTSATAVIENGLAAIGSGVAGVGYTDGVYALTISGGGGSGAAATVTITGGAVASVQVTNSGAGYTGTPTFSLPAGAGTGTTAATFLGSLGSVAVNTASSIGGAGDITINSTVTNNAVTKIGGGTLLFNGTGNTSAVIVSAGAFGGFGVSSAAVSVDSGARITGGGRGTVGTFTTTSTLTLNAGSIYQLDFNSTLGGFDKLVANGLTLSNATLSLNDLGSGGGLTIGSTFTILDKTGAGSVGGTFLGLNEGDSISANDTTFTVSYVGGTGNDITLTVLSTVPEPSTFAMLAGAGALAVAALRRRKITSV